MRGRDIFAARQEEQYDLTVAKVGTGAGTVTSSPAGIDCGTDCTAVVDHGAIVTLTATAAVGSTFTGWDGGECIGTSTSTVPMTAATTVTATFALTQYKLQVIEMGSGDGFVVFSPAGSSCGGPCRQFPPGTTVTLTATPAVSSIFGGWSCGGCSGTGTCTVTMTSDITMGANFRLLLWILTVAKMGNGSGTVTSLPGTINCGTTCSQAVVNGSPVTLTATPSAGSAFARWSGGGCTGTGTCRVMVMASTTVNATFVPGG